MVSAFAEFERSLISERVKGGTREGESNGQEAGATEN